jgi:hypothetical protein
MEANAMATDIVLTQADVDDIAKKLDEFGAVLNDREKVHTTRHARTRRARNREGRASRHSTAVVGPSTARSAVAVVWIPQRIPEGDRQPLLYEPDRSH